jgi:hypothetical protein
MKISRANAENAGDAGISMCKMQTAMIPPDLIAFWKLQSANRNGLRF